MILYNIKVFINFYGKPIILKYNNWVMSLSMKLSSQVNKYVIRC